MTGPIDMTPAIAELRRQLNIARRQQDGSRVNAEDKERSAAAHRRSEATHRLVADSLEHAIRLLGDEPN